MVIFYKTSQKHTHSNDRRAISLGQPFHLTSSSHTWRPRCRKGNERRMLAATNLLKLDQSSEQKQIKTLALKFQLRKWRVIYASCPLSTLQFQLPKMNPKPEHLGPNFSPSNEGFTGTSKMGVPCEKARSSKFYTIKLFLRKLHLVLFQIPK